jgi:hypothetical protein
MKTEHGVAAAWILCADIKDTVARGDIDGRQENMVAACLASPLHDSVPVGAEFLAIQVAVGVYVMHDE